MDPSIEIGCAAYAMKKKLKSGFLLSYGDLVNDFSNILLVNPSMGSL